MPYGIPAGRQETRVCPARPVPAVGDVLSLRDDILRVLAGRYSSPCLYGSVARGEAVAGSDIDIAATALPGTGPEWDRILSNELAGISGIPFDVVRWSRMSKSHRETAERDAIPLDGLCDAGLGLSHREAPPDPGYGRR